MQTLLCLTLFLAQAPSGAAPLCDRVAQAAHQAECHRVESAFWLSAAAALNGPATALPAAVRAAWDERRDGLLRASRQNDARLAVCAALGHGPYQPDLQPADFSADVRANYFPLPPARTLVYERAAAEGLERLTVTVKPNVALINGFACREVETAETLDATLVERTTDWFAQRNDGSVWYFGETSQHYTGGLLSSLDGSWRAGLDGALPGRAMPAAPLPGDLYRAEYLLGTAEDVCRIVGTGATVVVPAGTFTDCVVVEESSPLEPDDIATKYYAWMFGLVLEVDQATGGRLELISVK